MRAVALGLHVGNARLQVSQGLSLLGAHGVNVYVVRGRGRRRWRALQQQHCDGARNDPTHERQNQRKYENLCEHGSLLTAPRDGDSW
jgi:hypothetical protein